MSSPASPLPHLTDLVSATLGGRALACSDDFFASIENLVQPTEPVFDPDAYYDRGKVMDGWESRRKRGPGHDWCVLALGRAGEIHALDVDTRHFTGNHAPYASVEATFMPGDPTPEQLRDQADWVEVLPSTPIRLGDHNLLPTADRGTYTHLRLNIYPDGGVARLRAYGRVKAKPATDKAYDVAALANGGKALACSDMYFGSMDHLIAPGRADDMRGGWETRRRRGAGEDWVIVRLAERAVLSEIVLDTAHFKGNFPDTAIVEAIDWQDAPVHELVHSPRWRTLVGKTRLSAHRAETYALEDRAPSTHLRLRIAPCGGVSRMRALGTPSNPVDDVAAFYDDLGHDEALQAFHRCCGARRWAARMAAARPFHHRGALFNAARRFWWTASETDWREAFAHHPRIGADADALRARFAATADLSAREQAGVQGASPQVLERLHALNVAYEERFGHVFLICATGLRADVMLRALEDRIDNTPERELREAAYQQTLITDLRLVAGANP